MKNIQKFNEWINESIYWEDYEFQSKSEMEVADIIEEALLTKEIVIIEEHENAFIKLEQQTSSEEGEIILEVTEQRVTQYETPFDVMKWERLGTNEEAIETYFIVKSEDYKRI